LLSSRRCRFRRSYSPIRLEPRSLSSAVESATVPKTPPCILTILIACSWLSATELIDRVLTRIAKWDDPVLGIARICDASLRQQGARLDAAAGADPDLIKRLPLFGIPFAVKDNIDVAGPADHGRLSGIRLYPIGNRPGCAATGFGRRASASRVAAESRPAPRRRAPL